MAPWHVLLFACPLYMSVAFVTVRGQLLEDNLAVPFQEASPLTGPYVHKNPYLCLYTWLGQECVPQHHS